MAMAVIATQSWAGGSLYDVDLLLAQPHPFAAQSAPAKAVPGVKAAAPQTQVSQAPINGEESVNDPLEPLNRVFFQLNEALQVLLLRPAATLYTALTPPPLQKALGNVLDNLKTPVVLANDLLQGEFDRAWQTTQRFAINSTWGVGGMFDRASEMGIEDHGEDFGQTLATWGVGEGFYLVLPFFGPSNPRDAVGKHLVDPFFDPLSLVIAGSAEHSRVALSATDEYGGVMNELASVKKTSLDYYAAVRSMYRQKRVNEIANGGDRDVPAIPDLNFGSAPNPGVADTQPSPVYLDLQIAFVP
jgi:phospholipid-binding lipoprotein MlaA